jgi:formyl-CoA transferase
MDSTAPDGVAATTAEPPLLLGIRVLDLTHILAGPFCTQLLADAGAEVVKIEPPGGEFSRIRGPQRRGPDGKTLSSYSAAVNRGKRGFDLDLKSRAGLALFDRLVATADLVIDNFAPGALERLGVAYAELRERHPRLITASITLWGVESGHPLARRGGVAMVAEAEATLMHYRRDVDGSPMHIGFPLGDMSSGLAAYAAIVTALIERERTGVGRHVNISLVRNLLAMNSTNVTLAQIPSDPAAGFAAFGFFRSRDGWIALGVNSDTLWARLCACMGRPELATDVRYATHHERGARREEVNELVSEWTGGHTTRELVDLVSASGVPVGPLAQPAEVLDNPHFHRLGFLRAIDDGLGGTITVPSNPLGFHFGLQRIPPRGEDEAPVLRDVLGLGDEEIGDLREAGAFGPHAGPAGTGPA